MALPGLRSLADLRELDPSRLHVFVAGPGRGEAVALALPHDGWVFVDGCRACQRGHADSYVLPDLRASWGPERPVRAMVLTHPHQDHAWGFAARVEEMRPERIGVVGPADPRAAVARQVDALAARSAMSTSSRLRSGAVLEAARAILSFAEEGGALVGLHDGAELLSRTPGARITARSPTLAWMAEADLGALAVADANSLSTVLEVAFGRTRIVLGGDLPNRGHGGTGWEALLPGHRQLLDHHGFKLAHHGSAGSQHPDLLAVGRGDGRAWWLTPYSPSTLPGVDGDGLSRLVHAQSPLMLTAAPVSQEMQRAVEDGRVVPAEVAAFVAEARSAARFRPQDENLHVDRGLQPLDALWCTSFDDEGRVTARHRGRVALEVHRSPLVR